MSSSTPAYLAARLPAIIALLKHRSGGETVDVMRKFYKSQVYADFINDDIGLSLFSTPLIVELFEEEQAKGSYDYPEVV